MSELITRSRSPLNAETPLDRLCAAFITPQPDCYIRTHGNIPRLPEETHTLEVGGPVATPLRLTCAELRARFAGRAVVATSRSERGGKLRCTSPICGSMRAYAFVLLSLAGLALAGCSSSPYEPVNQTPPIRAMDNFFRSLSPPTAPPPAEYGYGSGYAPAYPQPGYAPAYPPYQPY
ncbi:MAG TPA: hypothetical protein VE690_11615 [Rhodopila sp.]|nr:hypothetical protein [Rhodopila sp.]